MHFLANDAPSGGSKLSSQSEDKAGNGILDIGTASIACNTLLRSAGFTITRKLDRRRLTDDLVSERSGLVDLHHAL